jgi:hypothetical protein
LLQIEQLLDLECEAQVKRLMDRASEMQQQLREKASEAKELLLEQPSKENEARLENLLGAVVC